MNLIKSRSLVGFKSKPPGHCSSFHPLLQHHSPQLTKLKKPGNRPLKQMLMKFFACKQKINDNNDNQIKLNLPTGLSPQGSVGSELSLLKAKSEGPVSPSP